MALLTNTSRCPRPAIADATAGANDNQSVVSAIEDSNAKLDAVNVNLGALIQQGQVSNLRGFAQPNAVNYY